MRIAAGKFRNRAIKVPKGLQVRPTTNQLRQAVFNICQLDIEGGNFLDLYAGSGAMGFEALSRGARSVTFIEQDKKSLHCIQDNIKAFQVQEVARVLCGDVLKLLEQVEKRGEQFTHIYVDPPYESMEYQKILDFLEGSHLVAPGGRVFIEAKSNSGLELKVEHLQKLQFKDRRRFGLAELYQFVN